MIDANKLAPTEEELAAEEAVETKKSRVPSGETPELRFIRLSEARTDKIIDDLRKLKALVSPNYKSTQQQRDKIISTIRSELERVEVRFGGEKQAD